MKRPLRELLSIDPDSIQDDDVDTTPTPPPATAQADDDEHGGAGLCIECGDQRAEIQCFKCAEDFCSVCFGYLHRTGKRKQHAVKSLVSEDKKKEEDIEQIKSEPDGEDDEDDENVEQQQERISRAGEAIQSISAVAAAVQPADVLGKLKEHCKYIPMRLTMEERKLLRLLEAALNVSEYTDKVDVLSYKKKSLRIVAQLREMCSILAGLVVASDMDEGKSAFFNNNSEDGEETDIDFAANAEWYKTVFEIGRRYKVMNPEKMRDSFGKLMYMIMDSRLPEIKEVMEFDFYKPVRTVYGFLEAAGGKAVELLDDPLLLQAVVEIVPEGKSRPTIQAEIRRKENAIKVLAKKYGSVTPLYVTRTTPTRKGPGASMEDIRQCLYSIGDFHSYLRSNRHPVESIIKLLNKYFSAADVDGEQDEFSLGIKSGKEGARLSHTHAKQFHYVHQSLTLWSEIMRSMFHLWFQADLDLVNDRTRYELADTGQGLNRIKVCPSVSRSMHNIIQRSMDRTGKWIGSSVVHLGDRAVPNALFFLDKYTQVPRILTPVHLVVQNVEKIARDPYVYECITAQFGSVDGLKKSKFIHPPPLPFADHFLFLLLTFFFFF